MRRPTADHLAGRRLWGEDLTEQEVEEWLGQEVAASGGMEWALSAAPIDRVGARNRFHALRHLPDQRFPLAVALGPASGGDYLSLRDRVERFYAIEPVREFWRSDLVGVPASFHEPAPRNQIALGSATVDLATAFSVLHHIPKVSEAIAELARVLKAGGSLVVREPIIAMGDFSRARAGLTPNERGIPHNTMDRYLADAGFEIVHKSLCFVRGPEELYARLISPVTGRGPFNDPAFVRLDALLSRLLAGNVDYRRRKWWQKLGPKVGYWVATRR